MAPITRSRKRKMDDSEAEANMEAYIETCDYVYEYKFPNNSKYIFAIKQDSLTNCESEAIVSVYGTRATEVGKFVASKIGLKRLKDLNISTNERQPGNLVCLDLKEKEMSPWKYVFMIVAPKLSNMEHAFYRVFEESAEHNVKTLTIPGISCSQGRVRRVIGSYIASAMFSGNCMLPDGFTQRVELIDTNHDVIESVNNSIEYFMMNNPGGPLRMIWPPQLATVQHMSAEEKELKEISKVVSTEDIADDDCVVCLSSIKNSEEVRALKCGHQFHAGCLLSFLQSSITRKCCPICRKFFSVPLGNQPPGRMTHIKRRDYQLEGEPNAKGVIEITYDFPGGYQDASHPRPGVWFHGTLRSAYLPNSPRGQQVLALLEKAFEHRLIFTVGDSITTGARDVVVWNNIHHKTSLTGGPERFGYPDRDYLDRVTAELADAGITIDLLA